MAISHACLGCGLDLARVRARLDGVLGVQVVVCPRCERAAVRRRHPLAAGWRRWRRVGRALRALALQIVIAGVLAASAQIASIFAASAMRQRHHDYLSQLFVPRSPEDVEWLRREGVLLGVSLAAVGVLTGVWLGARIAPARWAQAVGVWLALLVGIALLPFAYAGGAEA